MNVEDRHTACDAASSGTTWTREEEWYNFQTNPRDTVHVLLSVDESTYDPRGYSVAGRVAADGRPPDLVVPGLRRRPLVLHGARPPRDLLGREPLLLAHVLGGIEMAAGVKKFDNCTED